jgi:hypothetical protein
VYSSDINFPLEISVLGFLFFFFKLSLQQEVRRLKKGREKNPESWLEYGKPKPTKANKTSGITVVSG